VVLSVCQETEEVTGLITILLDPATYSSVQETALITSLLWKSHAKTSL